MKVLVKGMLGEAKVLRSMRTQLPKRGVKENEYNTSRIPPPSLSMLVSCNRVKIRMKPKKQIQI